MEGFLPFSKLMKIFVADRIAPAGVTYLKEQKGFQVIEAYGSPPEKVLELARDAAAIIVRSETKISAEVLAVAKDLKAVGRAGVGVDNIDVDAATERGVVVLNTPSGNTIATAELTFTHMLCGSRPIVQAGASMRAGDWNRKAFAGTELFGKTLGICGMGRIGSEVAKRAQAFGMHILGYDPFLTQERAETLGIVKVEFDTILAKSDYLTVHVPLTEKTRGLFDEAAFAKMKDGVRVFNCARGGIIKESALITAIESGKVAAAGCDVYESEPLSGESPLRKFPNVVLTPHLGASTKEAQEGVGLEVAQAITELLRNDIVHNAVNMPSVDRRALEVLRPYLKLGEGLGAVLQQITPGAIDKLRITYWGNVVDLDVLPLTRAIQCGYLRNISGTEVNNVNVTRKFKEMGIQVEVTQSNKESDYNEFIQVEAGSPNQEFSSVAGTLIGKAQRPRLVYLNGYDIEVNLEGAALLVLRNEDIPGIVGMLGTLLGHHSVNIANMSLSRQEGRDYALAIYELDSDPPPEALKELSEHPKIRSVHLVHA